jgi:hypothetical protein
MIYFAIGMFALALALTMLTLRRLQPFRRQFVRQLEPQLFDHLAHLVRDNADVFDIEHVLMQAL